MTRLESYKAALAPASARLAAAQAAAGRAPTADEAAELAAASRDFFAALKGAVAGFWGDGGWGKPRPAHERSC